jgi:hypothetical protein
MYPIQDEEVSVFLPSWLLEALAEMRAYATNVKYV